MTSNVTASTAWVVAGGAGLVYLLYLGWGILRGAIDTTRVAARAGFRSYSFEAGWSLLLLMACGYCVLQVARSFFGSSEEMLCTREEIVLTKIDFGRRWGQQRFARTEIGLVGYTTIRSSESSDIMGIAFEARGRMVRTLVNLEELEAREILRALGSMGYRIARESDPMGIDLWSWLRRFIR